MLSLTKIVTSENQTELSFGLKVALRDAETGEPDRDSVGAAVGLSHGMGLTLCAWPSGLACRHGLWALSPTIMRVFQQEAQGTQWC